MFKIYRVRIYPTKEQVEVINKHLDAYRFVYNYYLGILSDCYNYVDGVGISSYKKDEEDNRDKTLLSDFDCKYHISRILFKQQKYAFLEPINKAFLQNAINQVHLSFKNMRKINAGYPKFKSRFDTRQGMLFTKLSNKNLINGKYLTLFKGLKNIRLCDSTKYIEQINKYKDTIRGVRIVREKADVYFACITLDIPEDQTEKHPKTGKSVGIDLGFKTLATTSEGEKYDPLYLVKKNEKRYLKLQRDFSRKKVKSNNKTKNRHMLAKVNFDMSNFRDNYYYNICNELVRKYDTIYIEDLDLNEMKKLEEKSYKFKGKKKKTNREKAKIRRRISEVSLGDFVLKLQYMAKKHDKEVIKVDRYFASSQICHKCSYKNEEVGQNLNIREWTCPNCNEHHDRDINASINILMRGMQVKQELEVNEVLGEQKGKTTKSKKKK